MKKAWTKAQRSGDPLTITNGVANDLQPRFIRLAHFYVGVDGKVVAWLESI